MEGKGKRTDRGEKKAGEGVRREVKEEKKRKGSGGEGDNAR